MHWWLHKSCCTILKTSSHNIVLKVLSNQNLWSQHPEMNQKTYNYFIYTVNLYMDFNPFLRYIYVAVNETFSNPELKFMTLQSVD